MEQRRATRISRFLALVLRHEPARAGVALDAQGWVDVDALLAGAAAAGLPLDRAGLAEVVATNDKRRFALSDDGRRIRASQGHSVAVDLDLPPAVPPGVLYHGTPESSVASILASGLERRSRRHVHLSPDVATAIRVGARRGRPVVLEVAAGEMHAAGHGFFLSANGVWLVDAVPPGFLRVHAPER